jgi:hypothetical protein
MGGVSCLIHYDGSIITIEAGTYTCDQWYGVNRSYCSNAGTCVKCPTGYQNCRPDVDREDSCETYVGGTDWKPCPGDGG